MEHADKERILTEFESKMNKESSLSSGLFTYHSGNEPVIITLAEDYLLNVRRKLHQFILPKGNIEFQWSERYGNQHYDFLRNDTSHSLYYRFDGYGLIMGLYLDGQICHTAEFDVKSTPIQVLQLYAEMWLLQYLKDEESELSDNESVRS